MITAQEQGRLLGLPAMKTTNARMSCGRLTSTAAVPRDSILARNPLDRLSTKLLQALAKEQCKPQRR